MTDHSLQQRLPALDRHPAAVYLAGLGSVHSRRNMTRYLNTITDLLLPGRFPPPAADAPDSARQAYRQRYLLLKWSALRFQHVVALRAHLRQQYAPATVNAMLSAVRGTLKAAWRLGQMSAEDYRRAADVPNVKNERLPAGRDLAYREIRALLESCRIDAPSQQRQRDIRDAAMIALLYVTGMRRAEMARLRSEDYDAESGRLVIRQGKGDQERVVYVKNRPQILLEEWIGTRGRAPGPLFAPVDKADRIRRGRGISAQAVYNMLKQRAQAAGLSDLSPHDLRRTFVGDALDAGIDLATVSDIVGHASTDTTRRYDRRGERAKEQAASRLDI